MVAMDMQLGFVGIALVPSAVLDMLAEVLA